jgi:predicted ATPase/class 3 adenylate cyclase
VTAASASTTFLFTDIEGSTRLWEQDPARMRPALAWHDALARATVEAHGGRVVKTTGDGVHAAFDDAGSALEAAVQLQQRLADSEARHGVLLRIRCGLHVGADERRDGDFFGTAVNRAARIMSAAHGGQTLVSRDVAALVAPRLPAGIALRDLGSVRLRDLAGPERVFQVMHPDLRQDFPPLRSLEATPNNLPQQLTSFVGRERELADVAQLLTQTRLLTLLGIGGLGKSRISLQLAAGMLDEYPDGVWFVELAPVSDPRLVPQVLASVLGVKEDAGHRVPEALAQFVRDRCLLVVLDNCEHLTQACAELARLLLEAGPEVRILASSREHLNIRGETTYSLPPLALPDAAAAASLATFAQGEAVRLFSDRAKAAVPAFRITDDNAAAIAEICRRLDGIPLALELAAARVRVMAVEKIAERLHDRFRLLAGGDRTALPRQQTLRALIDWSFDLLDDDERTLFGRVAVFAGGFTLEAAEAVGAGGDIAAPDVLDILARLVEKSLVVIEAGGERYRMLETVRQYAQEKLDASGEADATRIRHLDCYVALAETARPELTGPNQAQWLRRLDLDLDNILAAHECCNRAPGGAEQGFNLIRSMMVYCFNRGLFGLGHRIAVEALARAGAQDRTVVRCRGLFHAGRFSLLVGRFDEAARQLQECLAIARELDERPALTAVLPSLAIASIRQGDRELARKYLAEAVAMAKAIGKSREIAAALNELAQLERLDEHPDVARQLYGQVLDLARALDDRASIAVALLNLAMVAVMQGAEAEARALLLEVHVIADEIDSRSTAQTLLDVCAGLAAMREDWVAAARFFGAAESLAERIGLYRHPADEAFLQPLIGLARNALGAGWTRAELDARATPYEEIMAAVRTWLQPASTAGLPSGGSTSR